MIRLLNRVTGNLSFWLIINEHLCDSCSYVTCGNNDSLGRAFVRAMYLRNKVLKSK